MHLKWRFIILSLSILQIMAPARAADLSPATPPKQDKKSEVVERNYNLKGGYFGIAAGYSLGGKQAVKPSYISGKEYQNALSGTIGALYAGYNFPKFRNFIISLEAEFFLQAASIKREVVIPHKDSLFFPGQSQDNDTIKWGRTSDLIDRLKPRLRLGYQWNEFFPYLSLGADSRPAEIIIVLKDAKQQGHHLTTLVGEARSIGLALGLDYHLDQKVFLRAEYRTAFYPRLFYREDVPKLSYYPQDFLIGLGYKF